MKKVLITMNVKNDQRYMKNSTMVPELNKELTQAQMLKTVPKFRDNDLSLVSKSIFLIYIE